MPSSCCVSAVIEQPVEYELEAPNMAYAGIMLIAIPVPLIVMGIGAIALRLVDVGLDVATFQGLYAF